MEYHRYRVKLVETNNMDDLVLIKILLLLVVASSPDIHDLKKKYSKAPV